MNQQSDEQIVRDAWERVKVGEMPKGSVLIGDCFVQFGSQSDAKHIFYVYGPTPEAAMTSARAYTESLKQEIAEIREEIAYFDYEGHQDITRIPQRILTKRLLPELERLTRGMKEVQG